jgi:hypothetical protein
MRAVGSRVAPFLPHILLAVLVAELALYRIAVPALRPAGETTPPIWHQALHYGGLYLFYFASALAAFALLACLVQTVHRKDGYAAPFRYALALAGAALVTYAIASMVTVPSERVQFAVEACFAASVVLIVFAQVTTRGDLFVRLGIVALAAPLLVHFYGPLSLRFVEGEQALWNGLPERIQSLGQWLLVVAAINAPLFFARRHLLRMLARPAPLAVAVFIGLVGTVVLRQNYEVGMELAMLGLGIDIGPGAPPRVIAFYIAALVLGTWTLLACLTDESPAQQRLGVGLGLVFVAGYSFQWPFQYLVSTVGLFAIGDAARQIVSEPRAPDPGRAPRFRSPPIAAPVWQAYVGSLVQALRSDARGAGDTSSVTVRGEGGGARTHVVTRLGDVPVKLTVERDDDSIVFIDIVCGGDPPEREPVWTLEARPQGRLVGRHPEPPRCPASARRTGDEGFDRRFRLRAPGGPPPLDEDLRVRATAVLDGWVACHGGGRLRARVYPGRGAPLDHPIPITELAFRGADAAPGVARLVTLLAFLADLSASQR